MEFQVKVLLITFFVTVAISIVVIPLLRKLKIGQIERNDSLIEDKLSNKKLKSGVIPENYYVFLTGVTNKKKPTYLLGRIEQIDGKIIQWKQEVKSVKRKGTNDVYQYEVEFPKFEGERANVSFRYIWLNKENKCYGVADQLFILKKI